MWFIKYYLTEDLPRTYGIEHPISKRLADFLLYKTDQWAVNKFCWRHQTHTVPF